jgi:hypothetical protein
MKIAEQTRHRSLEMLRVYSRRPTCLSIRGGGVPVDRTAHFR